MIRGRELLKGMVASASYSLGETDYILELGKAMVLP